MKERLLRGLSTCSILVLHIAGIIIIEACSLTRLVWFYDWDWPSEVTVFLIVVAVLGIHYWILYQASRRKLLSLLCASILAVVDSIIVIIALFFLLVPNSVVYITKSSQVGMNIVFHLMIITARIASVILCRKHRG